MKEIKLTDAILESSSFSVLATILSNQVKILTNLRKKLESCFLPSAFNGKQVVDPFRAKAMLPTIRSNGTDAIPAVAKSVDDLLAWANEACLKAQASLASDLVVYCHRQKWSIQGQFPSFMIDGFLAVTVSTSEGFVTVGHQKVKSLMFDAVAPEIEKSVIYDRQRAFDRSRFVGILYRSYERTLLLEKATAGASIPVKSVFQELILLLQSASFRASGKAGQFTEYTWDFFSRDLGRLIEQSPCETETGFILKLGPTSFPQDGIPVRQKEGIRIVGKIAFIRSSAL